MQTGRKEDKRAPGLFQISLRERHDYPILAPSAGTLRQKVHDMNIVATMLDNDIRHLMTFNGKDFKDIKEIALIES